jgi:hypothetical protein
MNLKIFQSKRRKILFIIFFLISYRVIKHVSSAPDFQATNQTIAPSVNEQQHTIELLQRQPLPTLSPST